MPHIEAIKMTRAKNPLGNRNGARALRRWRRGGGNPVAIAKVKADADRRALDVLPIIVQICSTGKNSFGAISAELNKRGILSARGRQWHPMTVRNLLTRADRLL
jgi:hypothetical protein